MLQKDMLGNRHIYMIILIALVFWPVSVSAQSVQRFAAQIESLNSSPAMRNPNFKSEDYIFKTRILDSNRQLVGRVKDMQIGEDGTVIKLVSDITRTVDGEIVTEHLMEDVTFHDHISAWEISLIFDSLPATDAQSLAGIAPAAGGMLYSMRGMIDAEVKTTGGRWVGVVKHILLNKEASRVEALVLNDVTGGSRFNDVTLPFDPDFVSIRKEFDTTEFRMDNTAAKAFTDYARDNR